VCLQLPIQKMFHDEIEILQSVLTSLFTLKDFLLRLDFQYGDFTRTANVGAGVTAGVMATTNITMVSSISVKPSPDGWHRADDGEPVFRSQTLGPQKRSETILLPMVIVADIAVAVPQSGAL